MTPAKPTIEDLLARACDVEAEAFESEHDRDYGNALDERMDAYKSGAAAAEARLIPAFIFALESIRGIESSMNANGIHVSYEPLFEKIRSLIEKGKDE